MLSAQRNRLWPRWHHKALRTPQKVIWVAWPKKPSPDKAGTTATDRTRRNVEAQEVRADADALGPAAHVLYTGDFNAHSSNEPAEQTLLAPGNGQDLLWETALVVADAGLQVLPATYHTFGNDGLVPLHAAVDDPRNTALPELANRLDVLNALANDSSDHMPVLQEYRVVRWSVAAVQATPIGPVAPVGSPELPGPPGPPAPEGGGHGGGFGAPVQVVGAF